MHKFTNLFRTISQMFLVGSLCISLAACNSESVEEAIKDSPSGKTFTVEFNHWSETPALENKDAEILAMESANQLVAPIELYNRTEEDLLSIRTLHADKPIVNANATTGYVLTEMLIGLNKEAMELFDSGNYSPWTELNQKFGVTSIDKLNDNVVIMRFERGYNIPAVAQVYMDEKMQGMAYAEPNFIIGASQDICLENFADDSRMYIFKQGDGDCPAGCIFWHYAGFNVSASGEVSELGQFASGDNEPDWFTKNQECRQFL
ncbi:hypothetical protein [Paraglaciecola aestuariivivens]